MKVSLPVINSVKPRHITSEFTEEEARENLKMLADFLEANDSILQAHRAFHMVYYKGILDEIGYVPDSNNEQVLCDLLTYECGSSACAVGWGPVATGWCYPPMEAYYGDDDSNWNVYCKEVFLVDPAAISRDWEFLFGNFWAFIDDTPKGAASRIRIWLEKGLPPFPSWSAEDFEAAHDGYYDHYYHANHESNSLFSYVKGIFEVHGINYEKLYKKEEPSKS